MRWRTSSSTDTFSPASLQSDRVRKVAVCLSGVQTEGEGTAFPFAGRRCGVRRGVRWRLRWGIGRGRRTYFWWVIIVSSRCWAAGGWSCWGGTLSTFTGGMSGRWISTEFSLGCGSTGWPEEKWVPSLRLFSRPESASLYWETFFQRTGGCSSRLASPPQCHTVYFRGRSRCDCWAKSSWSTYCFQARRVCWGHFILFKTPALTWRELPVFWNRGAHAQ